MIWVLPILTVDEHNVMHINITEVLKSLGWEDTPENRAIATKGASIATEHEFGADMPFAIVTD